MSALKERCCTSDELKTTADELRKDSAMNHKNLINKSELKLVKDSLDRAETSLKKQLTVNKELAMATGDLKSDMHSLRELYSDMSQNLKIATEQAKEHQCKVVSTQNNELQTLRMELHQEREDCKELKSQMQVLKEDFTALKDLMTTQIAEKSIVPKSNGISLSKGEPEPESSISKSITSPTVLTSNKPSDPNLCFSGFRQGNRGFELKDKENLSRSAKNLGANILDSASPECTHLVCPPGINILDLMIFLIIDPIGARTMKIIKAILQGQWIMSKDWIVRSSSSCS